MKLAKQFAREAKDSRSKGDTARAERFEALSKERCEDVIREYPATNAAEEARRMLKELTEH